MTANKKVLQKLTSIILSAMLIISCIPLTVGAATSPLNDIQKVTDTPTVNEWQSIFTADSTENAGGVWSDKSVFKSAQEYTAATDETENYTPTMLDENNFLVSLSAIASNKQITGYSTAPTDTVLVLDMSSSMRSSTHNSIEPLAEAANNAIKELLALNDNNRVGVVLYSGADENGTLQTRVLMPIDRYNSTTDADGDGEYDFIEYKTVNRQEGLGVVSGVTNSAGQDEFGLYRNQSTWSSGTFTQDGIYVATEMLLASDKVIPEGNIQAGQERMPIMVLMSDGEPSLISTDYAEGSMHSDGLKHLTSRFSNAYVTDTASQFMVQLTAAYSKYRIEQAYTEHDLLFYSLGLRSNSNFPTTILDPASHISTDEYWTDYFDDTKYQNMTLSSSGRSWSITTSDTIRARFKAAVTSTDPADIRKTLGKNKYRYYIDKYFNASNNAALEGAFDEIVNEIILQSTYYPTHIEEGSDINNSGYLSIVDTVGKYMEVKDIKNIQLGAEPFYGRNAARAMSSITDTQNLTGIAKDLFEAVLSRLDVDEQAALEAIKAAQASGKMYYTDSDFGNSIAWYGNYTSAATNPKYIAPYGGNGATPPEGANCIVESYYFYGQGQGTSRVKDMRYIEVEVVNFFEGSGEFAGQQKVRVRIPASLIPLVTYEVKLNGETLDSPVSSIDITGEQSPIRLVYEVGLKENINSLNVGELADAKNADGTYDFYTNKWDYSGVTIGETPPRTVGNSYAYFEPSAQNEYMYYQQDAALYQKVGDDYVVYEGTAKPTAEGEFYGRRYTYTNPSLGGTTTPTADYYLLDAAHIDHLKEPTAGENDYWVLPKGSHVFSNASRVINYKDNDTAQNADGGPTGTYKTSSTYYINHSFTGGVSEYDMEIALGNNGKLTMAALQGIRLQKIVPANEALNATADYEFTVKPINGTLTGEYNLYFVNAVDSTGANGATPSGTVTAQDNQLKVTLKANQTLYIADLPEGEYTVTEARGIEYVVSAINGTDTNNNITTVEVLEDRFATAAFTNVARNSGNLTISKEIEHPFGSEYTLPNKEFNIAVTLELNGAPLAGQSFNNGAVTTNADGKVVVGGNEYITLSHGEQFEIYDIPDGTKATVIETLDATADKGFSESYFDNGVAGDGVVDIVAGRTSSVIVVNDYTPDDTSPNIIELKGTKSVTGRTPDEWTDNDIYEFELQRNDNGTWTTLGARQQVNKNQKTFDFTTTIQAEVYTKAGSYDYRVVEIEPTDGTAVKGVAYDKTVHAFEVIVTDTDMDGSLEVSDVIAFRPNNPVITGNAAEGFKISTQFTNVYSATGNTNVALEIHKSVTNDSGSSLATLDGFTFDLYKAGESTPAYTSQQTTGTGTTRLIIDDITDVGEYNFILKETVPNPVPAGWQYDDTEIPVTVKISDNGDGTKSAVIYETANGDTGATNQLSVGFTNAYDPDDAVLEIDFVSKTLKNKALAGGDFSFAVNRYDPATQSSTKVLDGTNDINGKVTFNDTLKFDKDGTYFYNIVETSADGNGVITDKNTYRVVVTVSDIGGALEAKYDVLNVDVDTIEFVNTYTAQPISYAIGGTKTITGRALKNGEFTFVLTEAENAQGDIADGAKTYTAKNDVSASSEFEGNFTFDEITYDTAGTYYYVVTEQEGIAAGVSYSTQKYVVAVTVADNMQGQLEASASYAVSELKFENSYAPAPTTTDISGLKVLSGNRYIKADEFSFEINSITDGYTYSDTVQNDQDGNFVFENIPFAAAGTYKFVIKEVIPAVGLKGVSYDTASYNVSVTVTDNQNGKLEAAAPVIERDAGEGLHEAVAIAFYNEYSSDNATLYLGGTKKLIGRDLLDDEFTFILQETDENFEPIAGVDAVKVKNKADKFSFGELEFDQEGTYYYVISEDDSAQAEGIKYDDQKYYVTVSVTDNQEGELLADDIIKTSPTSIDTVETILFENKYTPKAADITVDVNVDKKVENKGSEKITAEGFEFALENTDTQEKQTQKTNADGKAAFALQFTENDIGKTYNYKLTEVNDGRANVTYSTAVYDISVEISRDDANNKLVATVTQDGKTVDTVNAEFVNVYDYTPETKSPKTGQQINLSELIALLFISGTTFAGAVAYGKKRKAD